MVHGDIKNVLQDLGYLGLVEITETRDRKTPHVDYNKIAFDAEAHNFFLKKLRVGETKRCVWGVIYHCLIVPHCNSRERDQRRTTECI